MMSLRSCSAKAFLPAMHRNASGIEKEVEQVCMYVCMYTKPLISLNNDVCATML